MHERIAVALRSRRMQKSRAVFVRDFECVLCSHRPYAQGLNRQAKIFRRAGGRCEIKNVIDGARIESSANIPLFKPEARLMCKMVKILPIAGGEIVDSENRVSLRQEPVSKV